MYDCENKDVFWQNIKEVRMAEQTHNEIEFKYILKDFFQTNRQSIEGNQREMSTFRTGK